MPDSESARGNPTLRSLAIGARCSLATVSYALRGDSRIAPETRARVLAEAKRQGYRINPLVATLMSQIRAANPPIHAGVIAGITWWRSAGPELNPVANAAFWRGAAARAEALGWMLEEFRADTPEGTPDRLRRLLRARGVPGLLVTPLPQAGTRFEMEVADFASAAWGYSPAHLSMHRACIHHGRAMALAWEQASRMGFKRIGLVIADHQGLRTEHLWETNYQVQQRRVPAGRRLPPLILNGLRWSSPLREWFTRQRPDVILTPLPLRPLLRQLTKAAAAVPLIDLDRTPGGPRRAGIDQRHGEVGAAAIDLIVGQLHANERGTPSAPKLVLMEGRWVEGPLEGPPGCG